MSTRVTEALFSQIRIFYFSQRQICTTYCLEAPWDSSQTENFLYFCFERLNFLTFRRPSSCGSLQMLNIDPTISFCSPIVKSSQVMQENLRLFCVIHKFEESLRPASNSIVPGYLENSSICQYTVIMYEVNMLWKSSSCS